jgi:hypothetical protein
VGLLKSGFFCHPCHSRAGGNPVFPRFPGSPLEFTLAKAGAEMTKVLGFLQSLSDEAVLKNVKDVKVKSQEGCDVKFDVGTHKSGSLAWSSVYFEGYISDATTNPPEFDGHCGYTKKD